jgi:predicted TIM-barrel fold metal-dependent hydrolase
MYDDLPIFDADGHIVEPTTLWWDYIDPEHRSALEPDTKRLGETYGRLMPLVDGHPTFQGSPMMTEYLSNDSVQPMQQERFGSIAERGFSPAAMLDALDAEGIDVAAVYPSFGLHVPYCREHDPARATALARAYNRWIGEFCREAGGRILPVALAPLHDPALSVAEIERAAGDAGIVGVMLRPNPVFGRPFHHPDHDPIFAALESLGIAAIIHEGRGANVNFVGEDRFDTWYVTRAACHPMESMLAFAGLVTGGVFDRHPQLRVGFLESGSGWVPFWLDRLDEHHEHWGPSECPDLELRPSEYFQRQCVISGETEDRFISQCVRELGAERVIWASDFPHTECMWPDSLRSFLGSTDLSSEDLRRVLWETPCWLYGQDPDKRPGA